MTDNQFTDTDQLAQWKARGDERMRAVAPGADATVEHRGIDTIAFLQARIRELRDENTRLTAVAICAEEVVERTLAGQIPRHVSIDQLVMALNHLGARR